MKSIAEVENVVNSKFVIFQEIEWPSTGGVDMDALPTKPVSVPLSKIRELRPAKTWKTWNNTVEIWTASDKRIAVRGTLDEIVAKLNEPGNTRKPFTLTPREQQLSQMRKDGYSLSQRALAFNMTPLAVAMADSKIEKKLEAPQPEQIRASRDTLAMMRSPNVHPDATT